MASLPSTARNCLRRESAQFIRGSEPTNETAVHPEKFLVEIPFALHCNKDNDLAPGAC
jgi:hypothetical protein